MVPATINPLLIHGALAAAHSFLGCGSIIGKIGLRGSNPLLFALLRETFAGICLFMIGREIPCRAELPRVVGAGALLFGNQILYSTGLSQADPVQAASWQCSIPIFTAIIAVTVGYETWTFNKVCGLLLAVCGALFLILCQSDAHGSEVQTTAVVHLLFFMQCIFSSMFTIRCKELLQSRSAVVVTSWAYLVAAFFMFFSTCVVNSVPKLLNLVCASPESDIAAECVSNAWRVPTTMVWPLIYWIVVASIISYYLLVFANQYAKASVVGVYTVVQPTVSGILSAVLVSVKGQEWASLYDLRGLGIQHLGIIGIAIGLYILFQDPTMQPVRRVSDETKVSSDSAAGYFVMKPEALKVEN